MVGEGFFAFLLAKGWVVLAAIVGAATGAWFMRPLSKLEFFVSVLLGAMASLFVAPAVIERFLPTASATSPFVAMIYWATGTFSMALLPPLIKRAVKLAAEIKLPSEPGAK